MKKILIWILILGSAAAYGEELREGFLEENNRGKIFLNLDEVGGYGRELYDLADEISKADNDSKFELNGYASGFSYGYEWTNRVSFELGVKVYVAEEDLEEEEYLNEEAWQHSLYASIGYRF